MSNDPIVRLDRLERSHVRMKRLAAALAVLLATACAVAMNVEEEAADAASSRIAAAKEVLALFDAQESGGRGPSTEERSTWSLHLLHAELEGGSRPAVDAYRDHLDRMESVAEDIRLLASEGRRSAIDAGPGTRSPLRRDDRSVGSYVRLGGATPRDAVRAPPGASSRPRMALRTRENMRPLRSTSVLLTALTLCSCSGTKSFWMRNLRPGYRVEPAFYEHAPDTIAVLPITPRFEDLGREEETWAGARAMRYALYRHLSVKDYDDLELDAIDEALEGSGLLAPTAPAPEPGVAESVGSALRSADVLGVWGLVSPWHWAEELGLAEEEVYGERRFEDPAAFGRVHDVLPSADAFVLGQNREFGWFYAVLFSFMRTGGELRLHAADGGDLLWKGGGKETRFEWILASIPEIPIQFVRVWLNTREASFDEATDLLLRRLVRTIPEIDAPTEVVVRAAEELSVFEEPEYSYFFWSDHGEVPEGTLMEFRAEEDGWYEVEAVVEGEPVVGYVFAGEAELVDADDPVVVIRTVLTSGDVFLR